MDRVNGNLRWDGCVNARDLGGLPTADGRIIKPGALVRSDSSHHLTANGQRSLRDHGIARILDLRDATELVAEPSPFAGDPIYCHQPMVDPVADKAFHPARAPSLAAVYCGSLTRNARHIAAVVAAIADAPPGGVLVHCHAGKDRTGMIVALVLSFLRVDDDTIIEDYAASSIGLRSRLDAMLAAAGSDDERAWIREWRDSRPATMRVMLDHLRAEQAGAAAHLTANGLTADQLTRLRERLTTDKTRTLALA